MLIMDSYLFIVAEPSSIPLLISTMHTYSFNHCNLQKIASRTYAIRLKQFLYTEIVLILIGGGGQWIVKGEGGDGIICVKFQVDLGQTTMKST